MESTDSSSASQPQPQPQQPQLPPGFRFHPTDEELVVHYLKKKASSAPLPVTIIAEVDLYKFDPWELPGKATFGEQEWYFFSPRDRKYPNGARPNRAATSGYWKATGTDKPILTSGGTQKVGVKKALVFYGGRPPKGIKTNWIMHEYRLADNNIKPPGPAEIANRKTSLRLDEWVLCRIYKKNNSQRPMDPEKEDSRDEMIGPAQIGQHNYRSQTLKSSGYGNPMMDNDENLLDDLLTEDGINSHSMAQLPSSSRPEFNMLSATSPNPFSLKRALPIPYWSDMNAVTPTPAKRFNGSHQHIVANIDDGSNSISNFLNQLPQSHSFSQQTLGSLGDTVFRSPYQLSGMNWSSQ